MKKYWTVFTASFQNEFVYRLNFILWRLRNILRILMTFFLWNMVFSQNKVAFGFDQQQMMTYVFTVLVFMSFIMAAPSNDNIGGEISNGDLSNYLVKPVNYLVYWLTRDWASKLLNLIFVCFEVGILWIIFKPTLVLPPSLIMGWFSLLLLGVGALIYYLLTKLAVFVAFWTPENTWALMFMVLVCMEILSGITFPLNILSPVLFSVLQFTPFPYLIYFPVMAWLGKLDATLSSQILIQALCWLGILTLLVNFFWKKGLKEYSAVGK